MLYVDDWKQKQHSFRCIEVDAEGRCTNKIEKSRNRTAVQCTMKNFVTNFDALRVV